MPALVERDWLTLGNAAELGSRIERYWAQEAPPGHGRVRCRIESQRMRDSARNSVRSVGWVRSNLINGLPPRAGGRDG